MRAVFCHTTCVVVAILASHLQGASASDPLLAKIPNGDGIPDLLGHKNANGTVTPSLFGEAFNAAGNVWTEDLCKADTDDDGRTNGQELGDPCCSWVDTKNLAYVDGISDPSDKKDKVRTEFFMNFQCTSSEEALKKAEKEAKRAKKNKKTSQATPQPSEENGVPTPDTEKPSGSSNGSAGTVKNPLDKTDTSGVGGLSAIYSTAMAAWVAPTVILVLML